MTQHLNVKPIFLGTHILEKNPYIYIYIQYTYYQNNYILLSNIRMLYMLFTDIM